MLRRGIEVCVELFRTRCFVFTYDRLWSGISVLACSALLHGVSCWFSKRLLPRLYSAFGETLLHGGKIPVLRYSGRIDFSVGANIFLCWYYALNFRSKSRRKYNGYGTAHFPVHYEDTPRVALYRLFRGVVAVVILILRNVVCGRDMHFGVYSHSICRIVFAVYNYEIRGSFYRKCEPQFWQYLFRQLQYRQHGGKSFIRDRIFRNDYCNSRNCFRRESTKAVRTMRKAI